MVFLLFIWFALLLSLLRLDHHPPSRTFNLSHVLGQSWTGLLEFTAISLFKIGLPK